MRIRNKEHQMLSKEQLEELCYDFPNDAMLGEEIRKIARATTNNPEGIRATSGTSETIIHFKNPYPNIKWSYTQED